MAFISSLNTVDNRVKSSKLLAIYQLCVIWFSTTTVAVYKQCTINMPFILHVIATSTC